VSFSKSYLLRNAWLLDSAILFVGIFLFYSLFLGNYPLFTPDEGRYSEVAREMLVTHDYITPRVNGVAFFDKPILYYWLQALAIFLFGLTEGALRFFPMLFGVMGCLVTYLCGRHLFNRHTGILSALILATTPLYFGSAHYADLNLEVAVLISATLLFFISAINAKTPYRTYLLFAAYFTAALAFLTKGLIGIALPGLISLSWIIIQKKMALLKNIHLTAGILFFLIIVLPWYCLVEKANPGFLHYFFITQQVTRFLSAAEFNNPTPIWFYIPVIIIGFFPWICFLPQAILKLRNPNILFLLVWIIIIFSFFSIPRSKTVGYILPVFPALALLVGHHISEIWANSKLRALISIGLLYFVLSCSIAALIYFLPHYNWLDITPQFTIHRLILASILFLSPFTVLLFGFKKQKLVLIFMISNIFFLLVLTHSANYLNPNSTKKLALQLKSQLKSKEEVISYFQYYQDLPIYLNQRITVVADWNADSIIKKDNWLREFWFGLQYQKTNDWLIDKNTFWQRYKSKNRIFVFISNNYFDDFKSHTQHYFILGKMNNIILLSNQK